MKCNCQFGTETRAKNDKSEGVKRFYVMMKHICMGELDFF